MKAATMWRLLATLGVTGLIGVLVACGDDDDSKLVTTIPDASSDAADSTPEASTLVTVDPNLNVTWTGTTTPGASLHIDNTTHAASFAVNGDAGAGTASEQMQICDSGQGIRVAGESAALIVLFDASGPGTGWCAQYIQSENQLTLAALPNCCEVLEASTCYAFWKPGDSADVQATNCTSRHLENTPSYFLGNYTQN